MPTSAPSACKHIAAHARMQAPANTRIQKAGGRKEEAGSTPARSNKKTARHATFAGVDDTGMEDSAACGGRGHGGGETAPAHSRAVSFSAKSLAGSARGGSGPGSRAVSLSASRLDLGTNARSGQQGASVKRRCASALAVTLSCRVLRCCTLCPPALDAYQLHSLPASLDAFLKCRALVHAPVISVKKYYFCFERDFMLSSMFSEDARFPQSCGTCKSSTLTGPCAATSITAHFRGHAHKLI